MGSSSSSSSGDSIHDQSVNFAEGSGGTVVQMGIGTGDARSAGGDDGSGSGAVNYNYNVLDGGAVKDAVELGKKGLEEASYGLSQAKDLAAHSLNTNTDVLEGAANFMRDSMTEALGATEKAMARAIESNNRTIDSSLKSASSALGSAIQANDKAVNESLAFADKSLNSVNYNSQSMMEFAEDQTNALAANANGVVKMFKNFAENLKSGNTSEQSSDDKTIMYVAFFAIAAMIIYVIWGKK